MLSHSMRRAAAGSAGGGVSTVTVSDGSIFDHPCDSLAGWTLTQAGNSTVTQGSGVFLLDSGGSYNASNLAQFRDDAAYTAPSSATTIYISQRMKINRLGPQGAVLDYSGLLASYLNSRVLNMQLWDDKIGVQDNTSTINYMAWTPIYGEYFWLNIIINPAAGTCDIKTNNDIAFTGANCNRSLSYTGRWTSSVINRQPTGYAQTLVEIDRLLVGTGTQEV